MSVVSFGSGVGLIAGLLATMVVGTYVNRHKRKEQCQLSPS
jgi:hypothetical protein